MKTIPANGLPRLRLRSSRHTGANFKRGVSSGYVYVRGLEEPKSANELAFRVRK